MIGVLSSHAPAYCLSCPANAADQQFQLCCCRNEFGRLGEVNVGGTLRITNCINFNARLTGSSRLWSSRIKHPRQSGICKQAGKLQALATVLEGDVVEYRQHLEGTEIEDNRKQKKLGVVVGIFVNASSVFCEIGPLRQEEPGSNEWVEDEDQPQVSLPLSQVQFIKAWPSQRMDTDRVSNPHGEHAHNVWLVDPASLTTE